MNHLDLQEMDRLRAEVARLRKEAIYYKGLTRTWALREADMYAYEDKLKKMESTVLVLSVVLIVVSLILSLPPITP